MPATKRRTRKPRTFVFEVKLTEQIIGYTEYERGLGYTALGLNKSVLALGFDTKDEAEQYIINATRPARIAASA